MTCEQRSSLFSHLLDETMQECHPPAMDRLKQTSMIAPNTGLQTLSLSYLKKHSTAEGNGAPILAACHFREFHLGPLPSNHNPPGHPPIDLNQFAKFFAWSAAAFEPKVLGGSLAPSAPRRGLLNGAAIIGKAAHCL